MSIRKKGSRAITVDGQCYRWRVRPRPTYMQGAFGTDLIVAVEHAEIRGEVMIVPTGQARPDCWIGEYSVIVTPAAIARLIRLALQQGWSPTTAEKQFVLMDHEERFESSR